MKIFLMLVLCVLVLASFFTAQLTGSGFLGSDEVLDDQTAIVIAPIPPKEKGSQALAKTSKADPVYEYIVIESAKISQIDANPKATKQRIQNYARTLKSTDLKKVAHHVHNTSISTDARFFAAYLLAQSDSPEVLPIISKIALQPIEFEEHEKRIYMEQVVLRAQALEGFLNFKGNPAAMKSFDDTIAKMKNRFVLQQARRIRQQMTL